ncbi:MAG: anaerobic ribonucleoside-triphosphate reductase activating protein [Clostridia bacterium]|nr:anaerobic ribonucleoside-triphosphate reductase activating protein [Clostridia bacterium]
MKICGLQKMTLLDFPGRVACTVFLGGCDWRCPFCHNYDLATGRAEAVMDEAALFAFLEKRRGLLEGVAITGGEPCLHRELEAFMARIRALGLSVKLDTNGAHPDRLKAILEAGLADYVAMDIKNSPEKYALTAGVDRVDLEAVRRSAKLLMSGGVDYEFRTTVVDEFHEPSDFEAIGHWIAGAKRCFLQAFTDRDTVPFGNLHAPSREKLEACLKALKPFVPDSRLRGVD